MSEDVPPYVEVRADLSACPSCSSGRLACVLPQRMGLDLCLKCLRVWERLPADEPFTVDGEQLPFRIACDTCAFRGKSPEREREDGAYWQDLQLLLASGGEFYCHKGVPFQPIGRLGLDGHLKASEQPFEYPRKTSTTDIAGETHPYQHFDKDRMRLCRGYLNAHIGPLMKKAFAACER